ncbi:MAG: 5-oxoprolinase subunit PxpB [Phycisphaerales bacterium]|nr:5-oxoprolinase subunit PxpB [Planctomycetota bacterium]
MPPPVPTQITWFGDRCLRLEFGTENTPETRARVYRAWEALYDADFECRLRLTPAYTTILAEFDPLTLSDPKGFIASLFAESPDAPAIPSRKTVELPVCYEAPHAPDLESVAEHCGLSVEDVVRAHSGATYEVAFIGFMPGFPYLVGLPNELACPRLPNPRLRVPSGSVAIADDQTGIYPRSSAGGWRLVGRTPLRLFDAAQPSPSLLEIGDSVRFRRITPAEFDTLAAQRNS